MTSLLPNVLRWLRNPRSGGVSRAAKGADCKSAALWLRRFESYLPHHLRKTPLKSVHNFRVLQFCAQMFCTFVRVASPPIAAMASRAKRS
jgi:hypothetical protein